MASEHHNPDDRTASGATSRLVVEHRWKATLAELERASKTWNAGPVWWNEDIAFFGALETQAARAQYHWDGSTYTKGPPFFVFQFTLAGWGSFEHENGPEQRIAPGTGFFALLPSKYRHYLSAESPGWTFGWINVFHPYLIDRIARRISENGPIVRFEPSSPFLASAVRLICGCYQKNFRDIFDVETAIFEFVINYERLVRQLKDPTCEGDGLLEALRQRVLANPKEPLNVEFLASEYGMSRSNFSHFFRDRTGQTPARAMIQTRVQEAARLLLQSNASLTEIAKACGFANVSHFNRVFRRVQHISPGAYRKVIPRGT